MAAAVLGVVWLARAAVVRANPDEWLLQLRDGTLVRSGVGIAVLRLPWDRVVRFPAAVQRVRFAAVGLTNELLPIQVEAFALWSVAPDDPLLACRQLGLSDTKAHPAGHLLSRAQYHAFQQALAGLVRRHAGAHTLEAVCRDPGPLAAEVLDSALADLGTLGARVSSFEIIEVRPEDPKLLARLSAVVDEALAEQAAIARDRTVRARDRLDNDARRARLEAAVTTDLAVEAAQERLAVLRRQHEAQALGTELSSLKQRAEAEATATRIRTGAEAEKTEALLAHERDLARTAAFQKTLSSWPVSAPHVTLDGRRNLLDVVLGS